MIDAPIIDEINILQVCGSFHGGVEAVKADVSGVQINQQSILTVLLGRRGLCI